MDNRQPRFVPDGGLAGTVTAFVAAPFRRQTYRNLAYLLAQFPLGVAYFVALVTVGALSLAGGTILVEAVPEVLGTVDGGPAVIGVLAGLVVLVPLALALLATGLVGVALGGTALTTFHRAATAALLGTDLPRNASEVSLREEPAAYLREYVSDPGTYLSPVVALATFPLGIAAFVAVVVPTTLSAALIAAPLLYDNPLARPSVVVPESVGVNVLGSHYAVGLPLDAGTWVVDTLPEALGASLVGLALLVATLNGLNVLAWLVGRANRLAVRYARVFAVGTAE